MAALCSAAETFEKTDKEYLDTDNGQNRDAGSTASTAVLLGKKLLVANVGDSRTVVCRGRVGMPYNTFSLHPLVLLPLHCGALTQMSCCWVRQGPPPAVTPALFSFLYQSGTECGRGW